MHVAEDLRQQDVFPEFLVAGRSDPLFPDPAQLALQVDSNPALGRYVEVPEADRTHDLFLHHPGDTYWESVGTGGVTYPRFKCDFLLHIVPDSRGGSEITVVEILPRQWKDTGFSITRRHGPGQVREIERVPATTRDVERLEAILQGLMNAIPR